MDTSLSLLITNVFESIVAKNVETTMRFFNKEAEFIDPHYPNIHMRGHKQIQEGFIWGFNGVNSFQFDRLNYFENDKGTSASVEVTTTLVLKNGKRLNYQQVFIIEMRDNKISRLQAYETYGPHGMLKLVLTITRLMNKLRASIFST